ncbi:MAG: hypothetical protein D4R65_06245 [Verrucomicrobiaceae bacterium]|nr:MAG: hypothetical protein D4R65_06245 [Verrucomicrobiaceae bacterium]
MGVTILGLLAAIYTGRAIATGDFKLILLGAAAAIAMTVGLSLGKYYWMLIPLTFFADGSIGAISLPFSYKEIGIIGGFGLYLFHVSFKKQPFRNTTNAMDLFIWANAAYLLSVYIRNPVGTLAMRTELVGGRPYFTLMLTLLAYLVISQGRVGEKMGRRMPLILACAMIIPSSLFILTEFFPKTAGVIYPFYSGVNIEDFNLGLSSGGELESTEIRITSLANIGRPLILTLCALYPPITLVNPMYFGRFFLWASGLVLSGLSGFRNLIMAIAAYMVIGSVVRKRYLDNMILACIAIASVILLSSVHMAGAPVPFAIQRALSFIPIDWDAAAIRSADDTADWRFEMWKDAWTRPDHMRSKMFGDGFGYTFKEMMLMSDELLGIGGFMNSAKYEGHLIRGSYHSGPLSTIKRVGFVGAVFLIGLMFTAFRFCLAVIDRTRNTPFFAWTLFISIPILYLPFEYIFIFGDYTNAITTLFFSGGMLKTIDNSLALWKSKENPGPGRPALQPVQDDLEAPGLSNAR